MILDQIGPNTYVNKRLSIHYNINHHRSHSKLNNKHIQFTTARSFAPLRHKKVAGSSEPMIELESSLHFKCLTKNQSKNDDLSLYFNFGHEKGSINETQSCIDIIRAINLADYLVKLSNFRTNL